MYTPVSNGVEEWIARLVQWMYANARSRVRVGSEKFEVNPASILYKSIAGRYRPVSYPDGPITACYRFIKNAYWEGRCSPRLGTQFAALHHCA